MHSLKRSKYVAAGVLALVALQLQIRVQSKDQPGALVAQSLPPNQVLAQLKANSQPAVAPSWRIASNQPTGTSILGPTTAFGTRSARKKNRAIISDSLWGNLMLEIAFDRDPVLDKLGVYVKLLNIGTMAGIYSVSMGTVYQTIYATAALNPPPPHQDSTAPGIGGIVFSSIALITCASRAVIGHELAVHIRNREIELRDILDTSLARLEDSHCEDVAAASQLKDLIGERASAEWVQIWRSTHLSTEAHRIGMETPTHPGLMATAKNSEGGM